MCGIVGYVGFRDAASYLIEGLRRLEYRGYDSAGIAVVNPEGHGLAVVKTAGRIDRLEARLAESPLLGMTGIGHTRWATHGAANEVNAHPHLSDDGAVAVVHNGVIENFQGLRSALEDEGCRFRSATDSEVIAQLVARSLGPPCPPGAMAAAGYQPLVATVQSVLSQLRGTYGLAILFRDYPDVIIAARLGSPLVIGVGPGERFLASDTSPLAGYTDQVVRLSDREVAVLTAGKLDIIHPDRGPQPPQMTVLEAQTVEVGRGDFPHYMLKEIFEQPESLTAAMRGRLDWDQATAKFGGLNLAPQQLRAVDRLLLTGCGTSWHAALVGEYQIEALARLPVEVQYASELRYRNPPIEDRTLLFAITQSGETADTLAALRELKRQGHPTLAICNVVGSTIAREADGGIYLHAGPEIGVASTKAFTSQCAVLALLALYFGRLRHLSFEAGLKILEQIEGLPERVRAALAVNEEVRRIAARFADCSNFLYLGRQFNFPTALEGALKLKEISYLHAEGYPAAEMKHGPIALVDARTPSVFLMPPGPVYDKVLANVQEVKARGGPVIAVTCRPDRGLAGLADELIEVPYVEDFLQPVVTVIPLQLLAYHVALIRGCDVDRPRNLAKSVTVE
jgi:glucosamine--fructose-6-phosphate aminotransferase (isomerizing)